MENNLAKIKQALQEKPWNFSFHQMLFILELLNKNKANFGNGKNILQEPIKLKAHSKFYAPSSDCIEYSSENGTDSLTINQTSLIGLNGILPQPYTEKILSKSKEQNFGALDFLNIFHQRTFGLMHKLEKKRQINLNTSLFENFDYCHAIAGMPNIPKDQKDRWQNLFYPVSSFLWNKNKNANNLITILNSVFPFKFEVQEFLPMRIEIDEDAKAYLNKEPMHNKILGSFAKCYSKMILVKIIHDNSETFENSLPGTKNFEIIRKMTQHYLLPGMKAKYKVILNKEQRAPIELQKSKKLGYNTWLKKINHKIY
jgi:type VI secretion system ImpH/TssG family protein